MKINRKLIPVLVIAGSIIAADAVSFVYAFAKSDDYSFKTPAVQQVLSGQFKESEPVKEEEPEKAAAQAPEKKEEQPELTDSQYLDNSLFIGDSRVVGIMLYGGIDEMDFFCSEGLTIYELWDQQLKVNGKGSSMLLKEAIKTGGYDRIYLEIGINEMGQGTIDDFMTAYAGTAAKIREYAPDADIVLCSIMNVTAERDRTDKVFNNRRAGNRNKRIKSLCEENGYHYLDINEYVCGEDGNLKGEYSEDSCHLKGKYDGLWEKCILENRIY